MSAAPDLHPLNFLSASLSALVSAATPSVVRGALQSRALLRLSLEAGTDFTADEALAEEGEVAVTFAGGERVAASVAGRDPTTDIALSRAETGDAEPSRSRIPRLPPVP